MLISTGPGSLSCQTVLFVRWQPSRDDSGLRRSITSLISNVIAHAAQLHYKSIAIPAIGCGNHDCSIDIVVETMVTTVKTELARSTMVLTVIFVIQPEKQTVYDEFCKHLFTSNQGIYFSLFIISVSSLSK